MYTLTKWKSLLKQAVPVMLPGLTGEDWLRIERKYNLSMIIGKKYRYYKSALEQLKIETHGSSQKLNLLKNKEVLRSSLKDRKISEKPYKLFNWHSEQRIGGPKYTYT